jgi:hypothetical protein
MPLRAAQPLLLELDDDGAVQLQGDVRHPVEGDPGAVGALGGDVEGDGRGEVVAVEVRAEPERGLAGVGRLAGTSGTNVKRSVTVVVSWKLPSGSAVTWVTPLTVSVEVSVTPVQGFTSGVLVVSLKWVVVVSAWASAAIGVSRATGKPSIAAQASILSLMGLPPFPGNLVAGGRLSSGPPAGSGTSGWMALASVAPGCWIGVGW